MKKQSADQFKLVWNPRKQLMLVGMQHYYDAEIKKINYWLKPKPNSFLREPTFLTEKG
jgi:hypothetical protein